MKLILLRHGESKWNLDNKFTGWTDVELTQKGISEAKSSAALLIQNKINVDSIFSSILKRAINTAKIVSKIIKFPNSLIQYEWRLNERHYGALQGLNKSETASIYGEEKVKLWRRGYTTKPPMITIEDKRHPIYDKTFNSINRANLPNGESLEDVVERLLPFWNEFTLNSKKNGNHLIVAHSNSLRAIVKIIEKLSDDQIVNVNIPTGSPLVYTLNNNFQFLSKKYLISDEELTLKQKKIEQQGKAK